MFSNLDPGRLKRRVAWLSVGSNTVLVFIKLLIGISIGAVSVISEAIHSSVDLLAAVIALFAVVQAHKPADDNHPFGHGKFENLSGTVEAFLILGAAAWIIYEAVHKLAAPQPIAGPGLGVAVMMLSSVVNLGVSAALFKVARKTESIALEADAWHLRTDVYTSGGVMLAMAIFWAGTWLFPGPTVARKLAWIDPIAAIVVALLIVKAAFELTAQASRDLFDMSLPAEETEWIKAHLAALGPTVHEFHKLRTRKSGAQRFVEFHLLVDPEMTVAQSHKITDDITISIRERLPGASVLIHIEPYEPT